MPQVVPQADSFGEVFIKIKRAGKRPRQLSYLKGMSEPGNVVVAGGSNKDLRFVFQAAERLAVNDAVTVTLESCAYRARVFIYKPSLR